MNIKKKINFTILSHSIKHPNYSSHKKKKYQKLKSMCLGYNTQETNFTMSDFIRQSKKLRSNVIDRVEQDTSIYTLKALLMKEKRGHLNTDASYLLRNVFNSVAYEVNIILQSPTVDFFARDLSNPRIFKRRRLKFLRKKTLPLSKITFPYITGYIPLVSSEKHEEKYDQLFERIGKKNLNHHAKK